MFYENLGYMLLKAWLGVNLVQNNQVFVNKKNPLTKSLQQSIFSNNNFNGACV